MKKWLVRFGWMAAGIAALYAVSALAGAALGGPLDPPGPPSSTYKSLEIIPPSWVLLRDASDGDINGCNSTRFACVMGGEAVFDGETGLVWQAQANNGAADLTDALNYCRDLVIANRKGWRVPTAPELSSLVDMAGTSGKVPDGNPFSGILMSSGSPRYPYWTTTSDATTPGNVTIVEFVNGALQGWSPTPGTPGSVALEQVWCVRAGENP